MIKIITAIILLVVIASCETELEYQPKQTTASYVLYSFLKSDSVLTFHVSKTATINNSSASYLANDGVVTIYENSTLISQMPYYTTSDWVAVPSVIVENQKEYRVTYESAEIPILSAITTIPKPVVITRVDTTSNTQTLSSASDTLLYCEVAFKDSLQIKNYYQLQVKLHSLSVSDVVWQSSNVEFIKSDNLFFTSIEIVGGLGSGIDFDGLFTDSSIEGKSYHLKCQVPKELFYLKDNESMKRVEFILYSLSYEYYQYYRSRKYIDGYSGVPFLNPVVSYSNVSNGLGCVSGLSVHSYFIEAK